METTSAEFRTRSTGALSPTLFNEIARLRPGAQTLDQRAEIYRLEAIAIRMRSLEILSERILSAVIGGAASDRTDQLEIPEFLRRY